MWLNPEWGTKDPNSNLTKNVFWHNITQNWQQKWCTIEIQPKSIYKKGINYKGNVKKR